MHASVLGFKNVGSYFLKRYIQYEHEREEEEKKTFEIKIYIPSVEVSVAEAFCCHYTFLQMFLQK